MERAGTSFQETANLSVAASMVKSVKRQVVVLFTHYQATPGDQPLQVSARAV